MNVALDTNACSRLATRPQNLVQCINEAETVYLSTVMLGELFAGFMTGSHEHKNRKELSAFLDLPGVKVIPIDAAIADRYGHPVKTIRKQGTPIPTNAIWIAAATLETGSRLVTYDGHFIHIPGLITLSP